jgi:hypothetical protein
MCAYVFYNCAKRKKKKKEMIGRMTRGMASGQCFVLGTNIRGMFLLQVLENETSYLQDVLSRLRELGNIPDR